jgi:hypothetical protein
LSITGVMLPKTYVESGRAAGITGAFARQPRSGAIGRKAKCGKRVCRLRAAGVPVSPQPRTARWATTRLTDDERLEAIRGAFFLRFPLEVVPASGCRETS